MGKPEPKKKARDLLASNQDFLAWIYQMIEKGVFANEAAPYVEPELS